MSLKASDYMMQGSLRESIKESLKESADKGPELPKFRKVHIPHDGIKFSDDFATGYYIG